MSDHEDKPKALKPRSARYVVFLIRGNNQIAVTARNNADGTSIRRLKKPFLISRETREAERRFVVIKKTEDKAVETFIYKDSNEKLKTKSSFWSKLGFS